jgi:hypothetical protein
VLFFEASSPHEPIDEALREAARVRQALKYDEVEKVAATKIFDGGAAQPRHRVNRRSF